MAAMTINDILKEALVNRVIKVCHGRLETSPFRVADVKVDLDDSLVFYPNEGAHKTFSPLHALTFIEMEKTEAGGGAKLGKKEKPI